MQLAELIQILTDEAQTSRSALQEQAQLLSTLEDAQGSEQVLEEHATAYADFCSRTAAASESLGLTGLAQAANAIADGLGMAGGLPLELRAPAGPLLLVWPEFFVTYLEAWSRAVPAQAPIAELLELIAAAEYLTPLDESQRHALGELLRSPPTIAAQQAALTPTFAPPQADATSLQLQSDADRDVVDGFLAEAPSLVERLAGIVAQVVRGGATPAQLELAHRTAHTLKGTAAIAGVRGVATLAHSLEDLLEAFRQEEFSAPQGLGQAMVSACEQLDMAVEHVAGDGAAPAQFDAVTRLLHAWASRMQGVDVPGGEFDALHAAPPAERVVATQPRPAQPTVMAMPVPAQAVQVLAPVAQPAALTAAADTASEEEVQVRIPAKALDKIFRAINELSIGLLRLRLQTDDALTRTTAIEILEQTANQRLLEIERRVVLEGLGQQENGSGAAASAPAGAGDFDAIELDRYNELNGATQALSEALVDLRAARQDLVPSLRDVTALAQRQLDFAREAQYQVAQSRLRPLSDLRARLRRNVRQTCSATGREANLEVTGDDLRVDAAVLGPLSEALLHLLRNSVDHGIEPPQDRLDAGKPREGTIRVAFTALGSGVVARISDDGKGLDHEAILDRAIWNGLVPDDANLTPEQIGRLIFLPGFSTRDEVTETSGRGVGLDAVSQAVASLQGSVTVNSAPGAGTEFRLFVLASVGTVHALHVVADNEHFLVPSIQLQKAQAASLPGFESQDDADTDTTAIWLTDLMHGTRRTSVAASNHPGLVVDIDGVRQRIEIDRIVEAREFLISPAPALVGRMAGVSGVATLADGSLAIALDLLDLCRKPLPVQQQGLQQLRSAVQQQAHILVADDSTSVRNTISALLRDANYRVTTARDGLEAMRAMMDDQFALVLTDLEMPQLNGFELTDFIRNRSDQQDVPVIMLTSRGQEKHRMRAAQVGVNGFMVKPYSDQQLLDTVRTAIGATAPTPTISSVIKELA